MAVLGLDLSFMRFLKSLVELSVFSAGTWTRFELDSEESSPLACSTRLRLES